MQNALWLCNFAADFVCGYAALEEAKGHFFSGAKGIRGWLTFEGYFT